MNNIIGRQEEQKTMLSLLEDNESQFWLCMEGEELENISYKKRLPKRNGFPDNRNS
jgi:hypothetical protein